MGSENLSFLSPIFPDHKFFFIVSLENKELFNKLTLQMPLVQFVLYLIIGLIVIQFRGLVLPHLSSPREL
jgi:hypothetical protein